MDGSWIDWGEGVLDACEHSDKFCETNDQLMEAKDDLRPSDVVEMGVKRTSGGQLSSGLRPRLLVSM